ncbi:MAG: hypothetical protein RL431_932 [Actinomycetota bacterium]|jgi:hypothetical protein
MTERVEGILHYWPGFIADFVDVVYVGNFYLGVAVMAFLTFSAIVSAEVSRSAETIRTRARSKVILSVSLSLWLVNLILFSLSAIETASGPQLAGDSYQSAVRGMGIVLSVHLIVGVVLAIVIPLILLLPRNPMDDAVLTGSDSAES